MDSLVLRACSTFPSGFLRFFQEGSFTDFTLLFGEKEYHVHRIILAYHSRYFEALFSGKFKESTLGRVDLSDLQDPFGVFEDLIQYFYSGKVVDLDFHKALPLLALAQYFEVDLLEEALTEQLESWCRESNSSLVELLQLAFSLSLESFEARFMHQIARNFSLFADNERLASFPTEKIIDILRDPDFCVGGRSEVASFLVLHLRQVKEISANEFSALLEFKDRMRPADACFLLGRVFAMGCALPPVPFLEAMSQDMTQLTVHHLVDLPLPVLLELFQSDELHVKAEVDVYNLVRGIIDLRKKQNRPLDKEQLFQLLDCVRFPFLQEDELLLVRKDPVIPVEFQAELFFRLFMQKKEPQKGRFYTGMLSIRFCPHKHGRRVLLSEDGLAATCSSKGNAVVLSEQVFSTGRHYMEVEIEGDSGEYFVAVGIAQSDIQVDSDLGCHNSGSFGYWSLGKLYPENITYGEKFSLGDRVGVLLDLEKHQLTFFKNDVSMGLASDSLAVQPWHFACYMYDRSHRVRISRYIPQPCFE